MNDQPIGRLVIVVGASGAGKDSVIKAAQEHFLDNPRIKFVRRVITRECNPKSEVHDTVTEEEFKLQQERGGFAAWWHANGLYYGLPANIHEQLSLGHVLIANGSRAALDDIRSRFEVMTTIHVITSNAALAQRLERRNRENAEQIQDRLKRNKSIKPLIGDDVVTIDNSGERHVAKEQFIELLESLILAHLPTGESS